MVSPKMTSFCAITALKITPRRQPSGDFVLCSPQKYAHFWVRNSFGKVVLGHKGIIKSPAYSRIQAIFNVFRGKSTKPKPNPIYVGRPKGSFSFAVKPIIPHSELQIPNFSKHTEPLFKKFLNSCSFGKIK
ncbi:MAG: hypothetical protein IKF64_01090 [Eubacterium sp.]|nr:hypothetical protein [Eubacterium sp.]